LTAAGFADVDHVKSISKNFTNNVLIARQRQLRAPRRRITLLSDGKTAGAKLVEHELQSRGYVIDRCALGDTLPQGQDVLALLEEDQPFLEDMDSTKLAIFKSLVSSLGSAGLLWVTRPSNVACSDPRYGQIVGLVRTIRSEMAVDVATLEMERIASPEGALALANVLSKFQMREEDGALGPDYEYAIHNGQTLVNRIFPFVLDRELVVSEASDEAVVTQSHPGRLDTLTWSAKSTPPPKDDEVEVEVYASGLNFRVG
jgi:hypothetical protein